MTAPQGTPFFGTSGPDNLTGTDGTDIMEGMGGDDVIDGGKGEDVSSYVDAPSAVTVVLGGFALGNADGGDGHDLLLNIEDIYGSQFNDTLKGDDDTGNYLAGMAGNDSISGGGGTSDTVGFSGKLADYTVTYDSNTGIYTLVDKTANRDGTDQIVNVQNFKFSDVSVTGTQLLAATNDKTPPPWSAPPPATPPWPCRSAATSP
jgi:Ca2+-binding RTX toxin-like protein